MVQNKFGKMEKLIDKIENYWESLKSLISAKKDQEPEIISCIDETPPPTPVIFGETLESRIQADSLSEAEKNFSEAVEQIENIDTNFRVTDKDDIQSNVEESKSEVVIEPSPPEVEEKTPLLKNEAFVKLVEECVDLMNEFDSYTNRLESDESKMIVGLIVKRTQEFLERAGLERIDDVNASFSVLLHTPVPMIPVMEGEPIKKILQGGLMLENRVFVKAKVEI